MKTSTDILQHHLLDFHVTAWLMKCDQLGIEIHTQQKAYWDAVNNFQIKQGKHPSSSGGAVQHLFLKESFIDTLISWIVADDQVHNFLSPITYTVDKISVYQCY